MPIFNEVGQIPFLVAQAEELQDCEWIVVDGGSTDGTAERAAERLSGARVLESAKGRARQMNAGGRAAIGEWLVFLHADTWLSRASLHALVHRAAQEPPLHSGAFQFVVRETGWRFQLLETYVAARCRIFQLPFGDQAIFMRRSVFASLHGFREDYPIMEDLEIVPRLRRRGGFEILDAPVVTSGRRYLNEGFVRRAFKNVAMQILYRVGVPLARLSSLYK